MALRSHLFPYRTQQLSSVAPKVVGGSPPARIGRRDATWTFSSAGRAPALQAGGHRFDPCNVHN